MDTKQIEFEIERLKKDISILEANIDSNHTELSEKKTQLNRYLELFEIKGIDIK